MWVRETSKHVFARVGPLTNSTRPGLQPCRLAPQSRGSPRAWRADWGEVPERLTYGEGVNVDDHEVETHGEAHGSEQPEVAPWGHPDQGLVLRQAGRGGEDERRG